MIKTIIFDLGNVIVPFDFNRAYCRMAEAACLSPAEIRARISAAKIGPMLESGQIESGEFIERINEMLGTRVAYPEFREMWVSIFDRDTLIPESLLQFLRERHRLLLLSNTNALHFGWLAETFSHLSHFHHRILSHEVKAMKPEERIYAETLRHCVGEPSECFFTDDIADYVAGARRYGIDAEQFTGLEKLLTDLRARGVELPSI